MDDSARRYTFTDLQHFDSSRRWELIDGVAYAMSGASRIHQALLRELSLHLTLHFRGRGCEVLQAPFDVRFSERDVVQPDLLVACGEGLRATHHDGAPDLVIEVCSPSTLRHDRLRKFNLYAAAGVPEYWIVTPHPLLFEVLQNQGGHFVTRGIYSDSDLLRSVGFPELQLDLRELAAALPPQPAIEDEVRETAPAYGATP